MFNTTQLSKGYAHSYGHHGELAQGVFEYNGKLVRGLLTMPCKRYVATAYFQVDNSNTVKVYPSRKKKAGEAAKHMLSKYAVPGAGGTLVLYSTTPEKRGCGSSTIDIVVSIQAVANAIQYKVTPNEIVKIAVAVEKASDPLPYRSALLFAQRLGEVIEDYNITLPPFDVLGFYTDPNGVETEAMPLPEYTYQEIKAFKTIRHMIDAGIRMQSQSLVAEGATRSAFINQSYLPKPHLEKIIEIVLRNEGLGIQVSHSGTVIGCLFMPGTAQDVFEKTISEIAELGFMHFYKFSI